MYQISIIQVAQGMFSKPIGVAVKMIPVKMIPALVSFLLILHHFSATGYKPIWIPLPQGQHQSWMYLWDYWLLEHKVGSLENKDI